MGQGQKQAVCSLVMSLVEGVNSKEFIQEDTVLCFPFLVYGLVKERPFRFHQDFVVFGHYFGIVESGVRRLDGLPRGWLGWG